MTALEQLAQFAATAQPDPGLRAIVAPAIADGFGCILVGAESDVAKRVRATALPFGGGDRPLFGTGKSASAPSAALLNAVAGHAWDLDDWEEPGNTHPTVVLLPALLAARPQASGAALYSAYAVGAETIMRLGEGLTLDHYSRGFHSTATLGTIGAAAAVARMMELGAEQTAHALSLAVSQASGYTVQFGSHAKPLQAGWAARNGLECAALAAQGVTGQPHVLDNVRGFSGLMGTHDPDQIAQSLARPGRAWALADYGLVLKPWPSCGYTHRLMTAALDMRPMVVDRLQEVASIEAILPDFHAAILPFQSPTTRAEALFSVPACVAQMLVSGDLTLKDSENGFWQHPDVARLIPRVSVTPRPARRPSLNFDPEQPDILRLTCTSGDVFEAVCAAPLGAPRTPMTGAQLARKFAGLTSQPEAVFDQLLDWPDTQDTTAFFKGHSHATP